MCPKYETHSMYAGYKDGLFFWTDFLEWRPARQERMREEKQCYQILLCFLDDNTLNMVN